MWVWEDFIDVPVVFHTGSIVELSFVLVGLTGLDSEFGL